MSYKLIAFLFLFVAISSCQIQKRTYRKGYHVSWQKRYSIPSPKAKTNLDVNSKSHCDSIVLTNGTVIGCKIKRCGISKIRYRACSDDSTSTVSKIWTRHATGIKYSGYQKLSVPLAEPMNRLLSIGIWAIFIRLFFLVPCFFVALKVLKTIKKNPGLYRGKKEARTAFVLSLVYLALLLIVIILIFVIIP